jgi:protein TonB
METKKTPEADLENGRTTFFLMGFSVVLSVFFVLLEWQSSIPETPDWALLSPVFIENEFVEGDLTKQVAQEILPETPEPEIVYEDYTITDEAQVVEEKPNTSAATMYQEPEESLPTPLENEKTASLETEAEPEAVAQAESMPQFPGGQTALIRFIYENIKYPSVALKQRIEGRVWCSFVVEADGWVSNVRLEESVYIFLDEEALRVLKSMPAWIPGKTKGENVRVKIYIPIVFKR